MLATQTLLHSVSAATPETCPFSPPQTFDPYAMDDSLLTLLTHDAHFSKPVFSSHLDSLKISAIPTIVVQDTTSSDSTTVFSAQDLPPGHSPGSFSSNDGSPLGFSTSISRFWVLKSYRNSAGDQWPDLTWLGDQTLTSTPSPSPRKGVNDYESPLSHASPDRTLHTSSLLPHKDTSTTIYYTPPTPADSVTSRSPALALPDVVPTSEPLGLFSPEPRQIGTFQDGTSSVAAQTGSPHCSDQPSSNSSHSTQSSPSPNHTLLSPKSTLRRSSRSGDLRQAFRASRPNSPESEHVPSSIWTPELERAITLAMLAEIERRSRARPPPTTRATPTPPSRNGHEGLAQRAVRVIQNVQATLVNLLRTDFPSHPSAAMSMETSTSAQVAFLRMW
ncbi:hypothetical protein EIP91_009804 [Steccherinum ochraceum]|uniref:Uncharacterized protein n=1 Tax=Steccherinum ochraceum TaxID=92696 RepID=A0A4R0RJH6_9APHY|nr:hypothetical protein EIP91_009804 [Steccherinum ochraceum]